MSSKGVRLRKRRISSLHAFSILAFGTSAGLDSQSFPFSSADSFIVLQVKGNGVTLVMFDSEPTSFGRIGNSDLSVAFLFKFNRIVQSRDAFAES